MKGLQITLGVILLMTAVFLMQQIVIVSSVAFSMNETCEYMSTGHIASPDSCQKYGYCLDGKLNGTGMCPDGYLYSARNGNCDIPQNVVCSDAADACALADDGTFVADPTDCSRYGYCINKKAQYKSCPASQVFDSKTTKCVYQSQAPACKANSVCRLAPNGQLMGDPNNCGKYVVCLNGMANPGECPNSLYYNKALAACQTSNPCIDAGPVGVGVGVLLQPPLNSDICNNALVKSATPTAPVLISDGVSCMGYVACTSLESTPTWNKCPPGLHFNAGKCVTPYTFDCQYDRCGNMNQTFVGAVGTGCKNYCICKNETSQGKSSGYIGYKGLACPTGRFFNEYSQECSDVSPASETYKLC